MPDLIFACDEHDYRGREREYRGPGKNEYYAGDYEILPAPHINVRIEKGLDSAYSVLNLRSASPLRFRRSWHHIREDKTDVCVLWFVKRGQLTYTGADTAVTVRSGECMITRSLQPFVMECLVDERSVHEVLHVIGSTHAFRSFIPDDVGSGTVMSAREGDCHVASETFSLLYEEGGSVSRRAAEDLARSATAAVGLTLAELNCRTRPQSIGDKRFEHIVATIESYLSNPDLSMNSVASACRISPRYLVHILAAHGTSYSELLWASRLKQAEDLLVDDNMTHVSTGKISYMVGFKSSAHFCRMFKTVKGMTPGEFRKLGERVSCG